MNIEEIRKEGELFVVVAEGDEFVAKDALKLVRLMCREGMSNIQAAFVYTRIKSEFIA
jgi:hypothetical protein